MMGIGRVKYELRPGDRLAKAQITKIITIIEIPVRLTVAGHAGIIHAAKKSDKLQPSSFSPSGSIQHDFWLASRKALNSID
jgi:hypothetical protein